MQEVKSAQSAQVSNFLSLKQHILILHLAFSILLSPFSYPSLQPLQKPWVNARHVLQYAPQHPIYFSESGMWSVFGRSISHLSL
jgi:hypothetical protein